MDVIKIPAPKHDSQNQGTTSSPGSHKRYCNRCEELDTEKCNTNGPAHAVSDYATYHLRECDKCGQYQGQYYVEMCSGSEKKQRKSVDEDYHDIMCKDCGKP